MRRTIKQIAPVAVPGTPHMAPFVALYALDNNGEAWCLVSHAGEWTKLPDLPDRILEEPLLGNGNGQGRAEAWEEST